MKTLFMLLTAIVVLISTAPGFAAEWGTLRGRFVVDGEPPVPAEIKPEKDPFCEHAKPVNERVVVDEDGGLQNAVVYLRLPRGETVDVHPDYTAESEQTVTLANKACRFEPRVTLLRTGQPLDVQNADPTAHNTKFDLLKNEAINRVIPGGEAFTAEFERAESLPLPVSCSIHPFMRGYLLVRDDPYMAVTAADGSFEIWNLPAGEHQFQFWHETGYLKDAAFRSGAADRRGRVRLVIPAGGELDLGDIRVAAELLAR